MRCEELSQHQSDSYCLTRPLALVKIENMIKGLDAGK